jgi:CelD/BcsL family acetyltransferase involved in cellulose biosynthesis
LSEMDSHPAEAITPVPKIEKCSKTVYQIQPLQDPRWSELVHSHPRSSAFHSAAWLEALNRTYGYQPIVYTTSPPGAKLENGLVFCRVSSWITGRRLVSLPFSDHCEPLTDNAADQDLLLSAAAQTLHREKLRYVEVRPAYGFSDAASNWPATDRYVFHKLDLRPDLNTLFGNFHRSSTQRKIQRAEREGLICESGRSQALLDAFWSLLLITRRRHQIPPQPKLWFQNLIGCFGEALRIRVALRERRPVAALLTLRHRDTLVYKYGCSDTDFNNLGGTQLLFWRAIQEAKEDGLRVLDLGRTDCDNSGLITFKDRWGGIRSDLTYSRFSATPPPNAARRDGPQWAKRIVKGVLPWVPDRVLVMVGRLLYEHIA